ncbi:aminoacyl-histidine dipeptidase [Pontibacter sp. BT310]|uniref:Aminoacyl-histidine dipeptidase n=1 Tax=Pontibacter populi TaxID=890055 RepID=A0ABS6XB47_9BACT|nr:MULTISPECIES: aminoacyl-histidine dipeptidase [Pontibacter]MBJ6118353.1 aminoacyl-histidine dipeptidase [Pontibacter sp. BT310]MBR0570780.1 aminoacyl-histidine dipeptidase [Microvirga sp. STS03]MBW3365206.1 aminoacyl-histidine dipeptidase [Pontibacter populi]
MNEEIRELEPKALWNYFTDLNAVPRPSKKEERVIQFMKDFGNSLGLETMVDEIGNVIIKKPATAGMENRQTILLQSHLDMVHQKNAETNFDFNSQGIEMFVEGDWVKAKGTTLGADNGIGVATIMALLASDNIPHPPLEALFTIDEETGMTGALGLKGGMLEASIMLNLDTEDDTELTIGCAGGVDVTATGNYSSETATANSTGFRLSIKGLTGGHSGMDIHLGRGNANKLMNRILAQAAEQFGVQVSEIDGGSLRNAIPRESFAVVAVTQDKAKAFEEFVATQKDILKKEYNTTDPNLEVTIEATTAPTQVLAQDFQNKLLRSIYACPNGIYRLSPDIENLVQTSNNVARVLVKNGEYSIQCLTRSSVDSEKMDLANAIRSTFELAGAAVTFKGSYPGWTPLPGAAIVQVMSDLYRELFDGEPHVNACHAGLECGIVGGNYPDMEMISFGPNIRGAHSPDEKVQISSVQKYWGFLLETLERIPVKV